MTDVVYSIISENVQGPKLCKCTKFHAFMKNLVSHIF